MATEPKLNRRELLTAAAALSAVALLDRRALAAPPAPPDPIVTTTHGRVRGFFNGYSPATPGYVPETGPLVACFKGIPYGLDTEQTRFAAPKPPLPWTSIRDCNVWGSRAPQLAGSRPRHGDGPGLAAQPGYHLPPDEGVESEDCLHLNVWTPEPLGLGAKSSKKRPVMVYIHGGAYSNGTANAQLYDGTRLARRGDAVVVTVNHRLNLFGYLYLAQLLPGQGFEDSGNAGQLDLVLALQWVRDNIEAFGGDPSRVLIFGQSGGGAKCATLMAQPPAHGLFQRVITMSGEQVTGSEPAHASQRAQPVLKALGLSAAKPEAAARALRSFSMEKLQSVARLGGYYGPVTDGRSLPVDPFSPTDPKLSTAIPMILGNAHDETRFLIGGGHPEFFSLTWETLPAALERNSPNLRSSTVSLPVPEVIAKYRQWHPSYSPSDIFFAVTTDSRSWRGEIIEANRRAADPVAQPHTWVYQLNWKSPVDGGRFGAPHTLDIPLAFDNAALSPGMVGATAADQTRAQKMADIVSATFIAFARTGLPDNPHAPHWPPYDLAKRPTMIFDLPSRIEDDPRGRERRYLGQVPYTQPGT